MAELRYDPLFDELRLIAPERLHRPISIEERRPQSSGECPFCPGREHLTTKEIFALKRDGKWLTRVIPNLYKAAQIETPFVYESEGIFEKWGAYGAHEVIVDTPNHYERLDRMSEEEWFNLLYTIKARIVDLAKDSKLVCINVFKNVGVMAGASQSHPHTQIIALPMMSKAQKGMCERLFEHYLEHGNKLMQRIVENEKDRIIAKRGLFTAFAPFASAFAFEVQIASECMGIHRCDSGDLRDLTALLKAIVDGLYGELGALDFNILFYLPPINENFENERYFKDLDRFFSFFVRITPRIYHLAGFELESSMQINPVLPEHVAKLLARRVQ